MYHDGPFKRFFWRFTVWEQQKQWSTLGIFSYTWWIRLLDKSTTWYVGSQCEYSHLEYTYTDTHTHTHTHTHTQTHTHTHTPHHSRSILACAWWDDGCLPYYSFLNTCDFLRNFLSDFGYGLSYLLAQRENTSLTLRRCVHSAIRMFLPKMLYVRGDS